MRVFVTALAATLLIFLHVNAHAAPLDGLEDDTPPGQDLLQTGLGLLGGLPMGNLLNTSGVSAPGITIGSGSSSTGTSLPGALTSLFGALPTLNLGLGAPLSGQSAPSLFESLFGALPGAAATATNAAGGGLNSLSQSLSLSTRNIAQSFSSSLSNIFSAPPAGEGGGTTSQANTQNNLTSFLPVTAGQGSASSATSTTNNGAMFSLGGLTFNFGQ